MYTERQPRLELSMSHRRVPPPCSGGMCNRAAKVTVSSTTAGEGRGPMETQEPNSRAVGAQAGRAQGGPRSSGEAPREGGARLDPRRTVEMAKGGGGAVPSSGNSVGKAARGVETRREVKTTARRDHQAETRGRIVYPWGPGVSVRRSCGDRIQRQRGSPFTPPGSLVFRTESCQHRRRQC